MASTEAVGKPPGCEQQRTDDQVVGADDPAQFGIGRSEVLTDRREGDIDGRDVDDGQEDDERRDEQRHPGTSRNCLVDGGHHETLRTDGRVQITTALTA